MKPKRSLWMALSAALLLAAPFLASSQVQIPAAINYQGKLTDQNGNALSSGYYVVEFRIWKDATMTGASELAWGRSFPLHVVTGGLFNVLLTDDGATLPDGGTGAILDAFGGPSRYLGLTVVQRPQGTVQNPSEIRPRQQLVSAPFTIQAQTANHVASDGVSTSSLAAGSVTTEKIAPSNVTSGTIADSAVITGKIADSAVTTAKIADSGVSTAKIADNAVSTAKIANGAVTSAKLNINGDVHLNDHTMYLRDGSDTNHGLKHAGSFAGGTYDGPALFGSTSGVLGTTEGGEKAALSWDNVGAVSLFGSPVDLTSHVPGEGGTANVTMKVDGMLIFYTYASNFEIQIYKGGSSKVFRNPSGQTGISLDAANDDARGKFFTWPIKKGDRLYMYLSHAHASTTANQLYFVPFGLGVGTTASDVLQ